MVSGPQEAAPDGVERGGNRMGFGLLVAALKLIILFGPEDVASRFH